VLAQKYHVTAHEGLGVFGNRLQIAVVQGQNETDPEEIAYLIHTHIHVELDPHLPQDGGRAHGADFSGVGANANKYQQNDQKTEWTTGFSHRLPLYVTL
jgi:hypothetical protein